MADMKNVTKPVDSLPDVRASILRAAGLDDTELARMLQTAVGVALSKLSASKTTRTTFQGEVIETFTDADHAIQLRAAELLMTFGVNVAGLKKTEETNGPRAPISISINLPSTKTEKDITPHADHGAID